MYTSPQHYILRKQCMQLDFTDSFMLIIIISKSRESKMRLFWRLQKKKNRYNYPSKYTRIFIKLIRHNYFVGFILFTQYSLF